jgi:hypothetical protein
LRLRGRRRLSPPKLVLRMEDQLGHPYPTVLHSRNRRREVPKFWNSLGEIFGAPFLAVPCSKNVRDESRPSSREEMTRF